MYLFTNSVIYQATGTWRARVMLLGLAALVFLLTASTYTRPASGVFFAFVLLNGVAQSAAGSYLMTSVVAVSSLFGPIAMQSVMSGQAAVGVIISGVQVLSTASSMRGAGDKAEQSSTAKDGDAAAQSAFVFFGLSTLFLLATTAAHAWLVRMPEYRAIIKPPGEQHHRERRLSFGSPVRRFSVNLPEPASPDLRRGLVTGTEKGRIMRVAKANAVFEFAVAYVFIITLVGPFHDMCISYVTDRRGHLRRSSLPLQCQSSQQIPPRILSSSLPFISSYSMSATSPAASSAHSPHFLSGPVHAFSPYRWRERSSSHSSSRATSNRPRRVRQPRHPCSTPTWCL